MKSARRVPLALTLALLLWLPTGAGAQSLEAAQSYAGPPSPYTGAIAPDFGGDVGLFTIPTGDVLPGGSFSAGLYLQNIKLIAGENTLFSERDRNRLYEQSSFQVSVGIGLTRHFEIFGAAGEDRFESRGGFLGGNINGTNFPGPVYGTSFRQDEPRKATLGAKFSLWSADSPVRLGLYVIAHAPIANDQNNINTRRTDWEWGGSLSSGIFTGNVDYVLSGRQSTSPDIRVPNRLRFAMGTDVPFGSVIHWITEIDRNVYDGPDSKPPDYSQLLTGVRVFFGHTGIAMSAALGANVDMLARDHFSPSPLGGILGLTYAPFPAPPAPPKAPPPPPATAPPAPQPVAPPAPQPRTTTDTVQFDNGSARLTNIAKAILDGVALRMKNDLNSTAVISGYTDNAGTEAENMNISMARAEAAKDYLVKRHGIDAARIKTEAKGSAEPAGDNSTQAGRAKNRRAVIVVTLSSGS